MKVKVTYKLISVSDNKAFFDLDESLVFDMNKDEKAMNGMGSGKGNGKLVYSIADNYPLEIDANIDFEFKMAVQGHKMTSKAKMTSVHKITIASL